MKRSTRKSDRRWDYTKTAEFSNWEHKLFIIGDVDRIKALLFRPNYIAVLETAGELNDDPLNPYTGVRNILIAGYKEKPDIDKISKTLRDLGFNDLVVTEDIRKQDRHLEALTTDEHRTGRSPIVKDHRGRHSR